MRFLITFILFALCLIAFNSCEDTYEPNPNASIEEMMQGDWKFRTGEPVIQKVNFEDDRMTFSFFSDDTPTICFWRLEENRLMARETANSDQETAWGKLRGFYGSDMVVDFNGKESTFIRD